MNAASQGRIAIEHLHLQVGSGVDSFAAVQDISLDVEAGEFVCLLGPSGCGKSTLLGALAGHLRPSRGAIRVDGEAVGGPHPERGRGFHHPTPLPREKILPNLAVGV
jgi:NitT/TauT family transport system ATP-binding protein